MYGVHGLVLGILIIAAVTILYKQTDSFAPYDPIASLKKDSHDVNTIMLLHSPDGKKFFSAIDEFVGGKYIQTGSLLMWGYQGGGSVFYYDKENSKIEAEWTNPTSLTITLDKDVKFIKKEDKIYFRGEEVFVTYKYR